MSDDPRMVPFRDRFPYSSDEQLRHFLADLDAVDPLRQPVSADRVDAALDAYYGGRDWRDDWLESSIAVEKIRMTDALAAADHAPGIAPEKPDMTAKQRIFFECLSKSVEMLLFNQGKNVDAARLQQIKHAAFPETPDVG